MFYTNQCLKHLLLLRGYIGSVTEGVTPLYNWSLIMDEKELNDIRKMVANNSRLLSATVDIEALIKDGIVKKVGNSYYVESIESLPKDARRKLKSLTKGRHGVKVEFIKGSSSMGKLANEFKQFRD